MGAPAATRIIRRSPLVKPGIQQQQTTSLSLLRWSHSRIGVGGVCVSETTMFRFRAIA